mgnify:FL=1
MAEKVDAATKKVEDIVGKIADMVTSVDWWLRILLILQAMD